MGYVNFNESEIDFMASTMYYHYQRFYMTPHDKIIYNSIMSNLGSPKSKGSPWNGHYPYIYGNLDKPLHHKLRFASLESYQEAVKIGTTYDGDKMADYCWFVETEVPPTHKEVLHAV